MKKLLLFLFIITSLSSFSQVEDAWVFLKDKPKSSTFLSNPLTMLSQRALDRRSENFVPLDEKDVPVDEDYLDDLKADANLTVLGKSKWLNAVHIQAEIDDINTLVAQYSFINNIEFANKSLNNSGKKRIKSIVSNHQNKFKVAKTDFNYGDADNQIKMLKGNYLHQEGLTGEGQIIAIIDAGFPNVNTLSTFQRIRDNNQILGGYNFADRNENFYSRDSHGTHVLSSIAGYIENDFVGTAPDAKFYLFISEIAQTVTVLEETLWVEAAERADSLGVNVINTSLGYTTYDNANHSHTYEDMDGKTTFISRGAEIGASRGLLLINAAGNEGSKTWKYIGAPADAASVITVGAVDYLGNIASFSSFGPSSDGRIKPEILGQGQNPALINYATGEIMTSSSGTSFSSPIMAGLIACLNQNRSFVLRSSAKNRTNYNSDLIESVFKSADRFNNPTEQHGYGIPNFENALNFYISTGSIEDAILSKLEIYPNPINDFFQFSSNIDVFTDFKFQIYTVLGKKILEKENFKSRFIDISTLKTGIYLLKVQKGNNQKILKLIKK